MSWSKAAPVTNTPVGTLNGQSFCNISYVGVPRQELSSNDAQYSHVRDRAINHNTKEGVNPMTKVEQDFERELNWKLVKQVTMSIFSMDISRFSFPVGYCEDRTFIERAADLFSFLSTGFIDAAIAKPAPEDRLSVLTVGILAGFHLLLLSKKPWNPALGETFVARWPNGVTLYGEQTSHHPAVTCIQVYGAQWRIDATLHFEINQGLMQVDILQKGSVRLTLHDGSRYEWEFPTIRATGILRGDRIVRAKGPFAVKDLTHSLECEIDINPKDSKKKGIRNSRATTIWGGVRSSASAKSPLLKIITGDYTDKIFVDGVSTWNINQDLTSRPTEVIDDQDLLPSDGRFRIDRGYLIRGDETSAAKAKTLLEELARHDEKLRSLPHRTDGRINQL
jgi:hypothetical protein